MKTALAVAALALIAAACLWHRAGRPRRERLTGTDRLTLRQRAAWWRVRYGWRQDADEPAYEDREQP